MCNLFTSVWFGYLKEKTQVFQWLKTNFFNCWLHITSPPPSPAHKYLLRDSQKSHRSSWKICSLSSISLAFGSLERPNPPPWSPLLLIAGICGHRKSPLVQTMAEVRGGSCTPRHSHSFAEKSPTCWPLWPNLGTALADGNLLSAPLSHIVWDGNSMIGTSWASWPCSPRHRH